MQKSNYLPPLSGSNSDPVLYGVAVGLAEMFPLVELSSSHEEMEEQIEEDDHSEQAA